MIDLNIKFKYRTRFTSDFKKNYEKIKKHGKDINKLRQVIE